MLKNNNVPAFRKLAFWWDVTINNHHTTNNQKKKILGMNAMYSIRELKWVDLRATLDCVSESHL